MNNEEMTAILTKLVKVGLAKCEMCGGTNKFTEINDFKGALLCPECLKKAAWKSDESIELPSES